MIIIIDINDPIICPDIFRLLQFSSNHSKGKVQKQELNITVNRVQMSSTQK